MGRSASAARQAPEEFYDENVTTWKPGVNRQALAKGAQTVIFYFKSKLDSALSREDGRPRYQKVPYVRITQPGDRDNIVNRQAWIDDSGEYDMADNARFAAEWEHFQRNGESAGPTGTPLEAWPALAAEQVDELKHFNIRTVEQLADMTDGNAQKFMGIRALQRLAKDYLEAAKDGAVVTKLHGELEDMRVRTRDVEKQLADNAETIRQLREMLEAQQRGRAEVIPPVEEVPGGDGGPVGEEREPDLKVTGSFLKPKKKT